MVAVVVAGIPQAVVVMAMAVEASPEVFLLVVHPVAVILGAVVLLAVLPVGILLLLRSMTVKAGTDVDQGPLIPVDHGTRKSRNRIHLHFRSFLQVPPRIRHGSMLDAVVAGSGRSSAAFSWLMLVEDPATSFEDLGMPGECEDTTWESLDDKIRSAVSKLYEGKLGKFLLRKSEEMRRGGMTLIRGRQILRLICQWFQTNNSMRQVYGLKELSMVELQGDDLETFWSDWVRVLSGQRSPDTITPEQKEDS